MKYKQLAIRQQKLIAQYKLSYTLVQVALQKQLSELPEEKNHSGDRTWRATVWCHNCKESVLRAMPWGVKVSDVACSNCGVTDLYIPYRKQ
jgi:hypothetical protein